MKRFNNLYELGELIPLNYSVPTFQVSEEERQSYIGMLGAGAQEYLRRTGADPLYRGVKLIVNEE